MSKITQNNPFEQLFRQLGQEIAEAAKELAMGTVTSVSGSGIGISVDGDSQGTKKYTCNHAQRFANGDRVLLGRESGTWVVICKIGSPGGPVAKTSAMTQDVGADNDGKLYVEPYSLPIASSTTLGGVKPVAKTSTMTQDVGVDSTGKLYTEPYSLQIASSTVLGGVKPVAKTTAMTQDVGVDASGKLYTTPAPTYTLPTASSTTLGGVKPVAKTSTMTQDVGVDSSGKLYTEPSSYTLPTASSTVLGGVKPVAKTTAMTQDVGVDSSGKLYTTPSSYTLPTASSTVLGGVKPVAKTTAMTQDVGVDSAGKLYVAPGSYTLPTASTTVLGGVKTSEAYSATKHTLKVAINSSGALYAEAPATSSSYPTQLSTSESSNTYNVTLNSSRQLIPSHNNSVTAFSLGSATYPWGDAYLGYYGTVMIGNNTTYAKLGFFGHTANTKQTISLTSNNMGYTSVTASNYLFALNNLIGILREKYGMIG